MTTHPPAGGSQYYPPPGYPAPPARRGRGGVVVAGVVGVVVGGLLVGGAWLLFGGGGGGSSAAVEAPERVGEYGRYADVVAGEERGEQVAERYRDWDRRSSERLSAAHGGAGAVVQTYTDEDLEQTFTVEVVRASTPFPPYVPYTDPEVLGMDRPAEELREFGDVGCVVRNDPSQSYVLSCVRTDDDLTVRVTRANGDLLEDPEGVAALVDAAWEQVD